MPNYHHRWCEVCKEMRVHDSGKCISCTQNDKATAVDRDQIRTSEHPRLIENPPDPKPNSPNSD
jgi:molybdenum cofactor biosynthesis enzyme MoaA